MRNENNVCQFVADAESGRSMVEMLGSLAIMGVLSAGAIGGYSYAMNKHRTNELIYEATKRAQWVGTQLELGSEPSLNTFGADSFGFGSFSGIDNNLPNANQFGIKVADLKEAVCDNLVNHLERTGVIRDVTNVDCNAGTATLVFNRDLSTSDSEITPDEPEVSGEASASAGAVSEPTTQNPDDVHCNGNGSWNGSSCYCDPDWDGDSCSEHNDEPESSERATRATINNESVITTTAPRECSGHGDWNGFGCECQKGWSADDCSEQIDKCSDNGRWVTRRCGSFCECVSNWGGSDCSIQNPCNENSGHGYWDQSQNNGAGGCACNRGWGGSDCSKCSGNGTWYYYLNNGAGGCYCYHGWGGNNCSEVVCSGHGYWCGSGCGCDSGWGGSDCSQDSQAACNNNGIWNGFYCSCDSGWGGDDCSVSGQPGEPEVSVSISTGYEPEISTTAGQSGDAEDHTCSGHGTWLYASPGYLGGCSCDSGWGGTDCSEDHTNDCSGHGYWYQSLNNGAGGCSCNSGWGGDDCSIQNPCNENSGHGRWCGSSCSCNSGWGGDDCSIQQ